MSVQKTVLAGYIMPHPPIIIPGVNPDPHLAIKTEHAMHALAADLLLKKPDTVVLLSPHAPIFSDYLYVYDDEELSGDLSSFGAPEIYLSFRQDQALRDRIVAECRKIPVEAGSLSPSQHYRFGFDRGLDHGAIVPLYFLSQVSTFQLVVLASSALPMAILYKVGQKIREAAELLNRKIVIIASGDQSHKANAESPYGTVPEGAQYDAALVKALEMSDRSALLSIDPHVRQRAAECGYRSIVALCGAYKEQAITSRVLSYEAPYGIGYCVASIEPDHEGQILAADPMDEHLEPKNDEDTLNRKKESIPVQIARKTLESHLNDRKTTDLQEYILAMEQNEWLNKQAGVFVSLKKEGYLRGCIGTIYPTTRSIIEEIMQNAVSAAKSDPRFPPVQPGELTLLDISVDILETPERIYDQSELDPDEYGVIVRQGDRTGLLLPRLDGISTIDEQLSIACQKGSIHTDKPYSIERFRVIRYV
ncbi:MAG: AmmeMemoRadiSam system protein A [Clostridiaceae bacterium]|jgi:AmmeMemoRadiSam system protein A|nr:AmmeMemoRadiSam system protein A [Clostridiaceae bacterium]